MIGIELLIGLLLTVADAPEIGEDCGEQVCLYTDSGKDTGSWKADARMTAKQRRAEAKKQRKRKNVGLRVELLEGRGSVFVDGRYLALEGEYSEREVKPGKHELEVRDGDEVIAAGVLLVSIRVKAVTVVVHGDR